MLGRPPRRPLFPYTTLFRSRTPRRSAGRRAAASRSAAAGTTPHWRRRRARSEEHTSELQALTKLVCRLRLEKNKVLAVPLLVGLDVDEHSLPATTIPHPQRT